MSKKIAALVATIMFLATLSINAHQTHANTLCVHPDGLYGCYETIQAAVDAASSGDTINVAEGTYTGSGQNVVIIDSKNLEILGGWTLDFSERDPETYITTVDGQNSRRAFFITGAATVTLDSLDLANGRPAHFVVTYTGGAILIDSNCTVTIHNSTIRDSGYHDDFGSDGGGLYAYENSDVTITDSTFRDNDPRFIHSRGAALCMYNGQITIANTQFINNDAGVGAVFLHSSTYTVSNSLFSTTNNSTPYGALHAHGSHGNISNSTFRNNVEKGLRIVYGDITLTANTFINNGTGIAIDTYPDQVQVDNNIIANNDIGIYLGGDDAPDEELPPLLATLRHNVIYNNTTGLYVKHIATATLINNIFADNNDALRTDPGDETPGTIEANFTLFHNNTNDFTGDIDNTNPIYGDPDFIDPNTGDYHLGPRSAAINTGTNTNVVTDIDGDLRPLQNSYDIGADETEYDMVVINEVFYDPSGSDASQEIIELYNPDSIPMDLTDYDLRAGGAGYYTLPPFTLAPGAFVAIHINTDGTDTDTHLYTGPMGSNMGNTAASVVLFHSTTHSSSTIVDYVGYGAGRQTWESAAVDAGIWTAGDFAFDVDEGNSINLQPDGDDNDMGADWQACDPTAAAANCAGPPPTDTPTPTPTNTPTPTPTDTPSDPTQTPTPTDTPSGPTNTPTPTPTNTPTPTPTNTPTLFPTSASVAINEILYDPTGSDTGHEIIELYNPNSISINLTGYDLRAGGAGYYTFPPFTLAPGAFVAIHINTDGTNTDTHLYTGPMGSNMGNTAASVVLFNSTTHSSSTIVDYVGYGRGGQTWESAAVTAGLWTAGDFVPDVDAGNSINLNPDGDDNDVGADWQACDPTAATANCIPLIHHMLSSPTPTPTLTPTPRPKRLPRSPRPVPGPLPPMDW